jgi:cell volume regulation protein A
MMVDVLFIFGISVVVAVVGHQLYERMGIPESVLMILLGLIIGPILMIIGPSEIQHLVTSIFTLSIIIILLESGLTTDLKTALETMRTSSIFTILVLGVTTIMCGLFANIILGWELLPSIIVGVICSGTSTLPILYFINRMRLSNEVNQLLIFESIINDVTIITVVTIMLEAMTLTLNPVRTLLNIIQYVLVALIYGILGSAIWTIILIKYLENIRLKYLTTLAASILLYSFTRDHGGSGVIAVMIFSVTIGNLSEFFVSHGLVRRQVKRFFTQIEVMQDEVTFLVKNIFFFIMGLLFDIQALNIQVIIIASLLSCLMVLSRAISYKAIQKIDPRYSQHLLAVSLMLPRGLTAGLAAFMPLEKGVSVPYLKDIIIVMILLTNISATAGFMVLLRNNPRQKVKRIKPS